MGPISFFLYVFMPMAIGGYAASPKCNKDIYLCDFGYPSFQVKTMNDFNAMDSTGRVYHMSYASLIVKEKRPLWIFKLVKVKYADTNRIVIMTDSAGKVKLALNKFTGKVLNLKPAEFDRQFREYPGVKKGNDSLYYIPGLLLCPSQSKRITKIVEEYKKNRQ